MVERQLTVGARKTLMISVVVMAHARRRQWAQELASKLDCDIVWDRINEVWDTARRAWLAYDPAATHHIVIQDDAIVADELVAGCEKLTKAIGPEEPVCLTAIDYRLHQSRADYIAHWLAGRRLWRSYQAVSGVGLMLPTAHIDEMVAHCDKMTIKHDDWRIREYYRQQQRTKFVYPIPNLVQHRPTSGNPTLVAGNNRMGTERQSLTYIGDGVPATSIDWTKPGPKRKAPTVGTLEFVNYSNGTRVVVEAGSKAAAHLNRRPHWTCVTTGEALASQETASETPPVAPPKAGPGSSRAAWAAYAASLGHDTDGLTKAQLIELTDV